MTCYGDDTKILLLHGRMLLQASVPLAEGRGPALSTRSVSVHDYSQSFCGVHDVEIFNVPVQTESIPRMFCCRSHLNSA